MELLRAMDEAFADLTYPGDHALTDCPCGRCLDSAEAFVGVDRREMGDSFPALNPMDADPGVLSPIAFRYFLPGLVRIMVEDEDRRDNIWRWIKGRFTPPDGGGDISPKLAGVQRFIDVLSARQRRAIVAVLDSLLAIDDHWDVELRAAREGLESGVAEAYLVRGATPRC